MTPDLVVTYGLRYSLLQPPFENTGNQVAPTVDMDQWFKTAGKKALQGNVDPARFDIQSFRAGQWRQALLGLGL